jgi:hypothetical protein
VGAGEGGGDRLPQPAARPRATVADHEGDHLTSPAAQRRPDPALTRFLQHERPEFVQLQHSPLDLKQRLGECGQPGYLFLSHAVTVLRETPKVRERPRKELRSA